MSVDSRSGDDGDDVGRDGSRNSDVMVVEMVEVVVVVLVDHKRIGIKALGNKISRSRSQSEDRK